MSIKLSFSQFQKILFESIETKSGYEPPWTLEEIRKNYGDKMYAILSNDPVHRWRAETGIELIHKEPTKEEFERIVKNWNLMSNEMKRKSDEFSKEHFGSDNMSRVDLLRKEYDFHVGDRVRIVDNIRCRQAGKTGTIIETPEGMMKETKFGWKLFYVQMDDPKYGTVGFLSGSFDKI